MSLLTPDMKAAVGRSRPPVRQEVTRREIRKYASATGQRQRRYLEGDEAPPLFLFGLFLDVLPRDQLLADGRQPDNDLVPELPLKRVMAGGSELSLHGPILPGQTLVCTQTLVELFEKDGAQGPLIFAVLENRFETDGGELIASERQTRIAR